MAPVRLGSLGAKPVPTTAHAKVIDMSRRAVASLTEYNYGVMDTIRSLVNGDILEKVQAAAPYFAIPDAAACPAYIIGPDVRLRIYFKETWLAPISERYVHPDPSVPIVQYAEKVRDIHHRFQEVLAVLTWLNLAASPSAVRYYFPAAGSLCDVDLGRLRTFSEPCGISDYLPLIRRATETLAQAAFLPPGPVPSRSLPMQLVFTVSRVTNGRVTYETDHTVYEVTPCQRGT